MWRSYVRRVWGGANFNGWEGLALPSPLVLAPAGPIASDTPVSQQMTPIQPDLDIRQTTTRQPTAVAPSGNGPVSAAAAAAAGGALPSSGAAPPQHQLEPWQVGTCSARDACRYWSYT